MSRRLHFLSLALVLSFVAGTAAHAQEAAPATGPMFVPPAATSELPFASDGANQPVLQTISPDGVPIDVQHMDTGAAAHGEAKKQGLPQFDTSTFARQLFWLTLSFAVLYLVFARKTLPAIGGVLEKRATRIASDLGAAEGLKNQVQTVRNEYESAIAQAQGQAQKLMGDIQADMKRTLEAKDAEFKSRTEQAVSQLEMQINTARGRILADLSAQAADLAVDITNRVAGVKTDRAAAQTIIDAETGKARAA